MSVFCRRPGVHKHSQGFTLMEILVAFVLMALVVGTLLRVFGSNMRAVALSEEYSFAVQAAESRLQTVGTEIPVEQGSVSGEEEGTPYRWTVTMEPIALTEEQESFAAFIQPYQVTVNVSWPGVHSDRVFTLRSLRFGEAQ